MLPNFLIIGAMKCGTTSLYHYLKQHPDVYMSRVKEARYARYLTPGEPGIFRSRREYEALFAGVRGERAIGEASPTYLNCADAPARMAADLPGVKLIVSLRNPADRAYSSYLQWQRLGLERGDANSALRPGNQAFESGRYYARLAGFFSHFDRTRIKVLLFEDLSARPGEVMSDLFAFLQIDRTFEVDTRIRHNPATVPRSVLFNRLWCSAWRVLHKVSPRPLLGTGIVGAAQRPFLRQAPPMPPALRARLLDQYADDIQLTQELIGRSLGHWLPSTAGPAPRN
jgi:hypothetical protein